MKILSIETSCDETAISVVEAEGGLESPVFRVLGNALFSQVDIHKEYGGVFPMLAKREHAKNLPLLLKKALTESSMYIKDNKKEETEIWEEIKYIVSREEGLYEGLRETLLQIQRPDIDIIVVTAGPGLEPALWVGISCAEALGKLWNIPVIPVNHMEGHIASVLIENNNNIKIEFPALALLISGGHTELVEILGWGNYKVIGQTRDDAVGEAFDKVARMLDLPYPGGPEISRLAEKARLENTQSKAEFTRPMIHSDNLDFSFSGLKTAVLYYIRDSFLKENRALADEDKADIAREFEDTAIDVLLEKTERALEQTSAKTLIIAGGVIANKRLREKFEALSKGSPELIVKIPTKSLSTDNSLMIACAGYINSTLHPEIAAQKKKILAQGNLKLGILGLN